MTIYDRIRARRQELGLTAQELAERTGYKDKSSISKIEQGKTDLTQSKVVLFAKVLDTTVDYLVTGTQPSEPVQLTDQERDIIASYRSLSPQGQEYIRQTIAMALRAYPQKNIAISGVEIAK